MKGTKPCETGWVGRHPPGTWTDLPGEGGSLGQVLVGGVAGGRELSAAIVVQKMRPDLCLLSMVTGILGVQAGVWAVLKLP